MKNRQGDRHTVSVIVPTIGRGTLERTRSALRRQTRQVDEVIIVEDIERRGVAWARNEGIRRSTGDFIAFTDDDCVPPDNWIERLVGAIGRHGADGVGGTFQESDEFLHEVRLRRSIPENEQVDTHGLVGTGGNVMYTRRALNECIERDGYAYSDARPLAEDQEIAWRLRKRGAKLVHVPVKMFHLRRVGSLGDWLRFQFSRGTSVASLYCMQRLDTSGVPLHHSTLWKQGQHWVVRWLLSFFRTVIGPCDAGSFSRARYFVRFWLGEKAKTLGFLWGLVVRFVGTINLTRSMKNEQRVNVDFVGIGAAKAGTSWLAKAMDAHPGVCLSAVKETNFFCQEHRPRSASLRYDGTNLARYDVFYKGCQPDQVKGEFSVHYMLEEETAKILSRLFPETKIIAVLREPVARFISQYRFRRHTLRLDQRPIEELLDPNGKPVRYGLYGKLLGYYFERFPRENIKVVIYEEMRADPYGTLKDVYSFVGADDSYIPRELMGKKINATRQVRFRPIMQLVDHVQIAMIRLGISGWVSESAKLSVAQFLQRVNFRKLDHEEIDDNVKARLRQIYSEDRGRLESLLGRSLDDVWGPKV